MLQETYILWISQYGYIGIFSLLMFGIIGLPIPDELLMTFSGYLVSRGDLNIAPTIASAFLGSICGVSVSYCLGRTGGSFLIVKYGRWIHLTQDKMDRVHEWFNHTGRWGLFIGYFIPGVRHLNALAAGTSHVSYRVFAMFAYAGGLLWCSSFVVAGFFLGKEWPKISGMLHHVMLTAGCAIIVALVLLYFILQHRAQKDG